MFILKIKMIKMKMSEKIRFLEEKIEIAKIMHGKQKFSKEMYDVLSAKTELDLRKYVKKYRPHESFSSIIRKVYLKAKNLNNIGGYVYSKDARLIAKSFFKLDKSTFDRKFCKYLSNNYKRIEIGQGISASLTRDDAIMCKTRTGSIIPIYYFMIRI